MHIALHTLPYTHEILMLKYSLPEMRTPHLIQFNRKLNELFIQLHWGLG